MGKILSQIPLRRLLAPVTLFVLFIIIIAISLSSSHQNTIQTTPIVPTTSPATTTTDGGEQVLPTQENAPSKEIIADYTTSYGPPDYNFKGSRTYGATALVYVYLKRGIAFIADPGTTRVYQQFTFSPMSLASFKQKYAGEILDFTVVPTLPEE